MAKSIANKVKGLFMSKQKETEGNTGSQAPNTEDITDVLDTKDASEKETTVEAPVVSDGNSENKEKTEPKPKVKKKVRAERTHERVSRIAAEKNTKGYGL